MKRLSILIALLLLLFSCKEKEVPCYTIQGSGVKEGEVYLWSNDRNHKELLTAKCDSSFTITVALEETTTFLLALPDGKIIPLFATPGTTATLRPDSALKSGWCVEGGDTQALHDSISRLIDATKRPEKQKKIIEAFTKKHPTSEVNAELYRRYLIDIPTPDNDYIRKSISNLAGVLQDHRFFTATSKQLENKSGNVKHRMFPSFNYTTNDGKNVNAGTYTSGYLLVNVWATWDSMSHEQIKKLRDIKEKVRSENFAILNISLDSDTTAWKNAIEGDSIIGDNVFDRRGMASEVLESFNITSLPYSVIVTPYKRIVEYDIALDSITAMKIDSLTHKHDTRNEKKEKKKENKKSDKIKIKK